MIRYIIVEEKTPYDLQMAVNVAAESGYRPVGGVAVAPETRKVSQTYMQAMVKEEE